MILSEIFLASLFLILIGFILMLQFKPSKVFDARSPFRQLIAERQAKLDARAEETLQLTRETNALLQEIRDLMKSSSEAS
jgi:F0F1-type ATP synthase membrane subunit b/b'